MTEPDHVVNNPGEPPSNLVTWEIVPTRGTRRRRLIVIASAMLLVVAVVVIAAVSLASLRRQDFALPASPIGYGSAAPRQSVPSGTSTPTPTPFTTPPRSPQPSRSPADKAPRVIKGHINFEHFTVAISRIDVDGARAVRVTAKVCVRSLPPNPQGNRTRISWDPWRIDTVNHTIRAQQSAGLTSTKGMFPADRTYKKGQCASGWIPFAVSAADVASISYTNGIGDEASWRVES